MTNNKKLIMTLRKSYKVFIGALSHYIPNSRGKYIKRYWKKLTCYWTVFSKKWIYFFHIVLYFVLSYNNKNNSVD